MGDKVQADNRSVTQAEVVNEWRELNDRNSDRAGFKKVVGKLEKLDYRLYGIKVHDGAPKKGKGLPDYGTVVTRGNTTGRVRKFSVDSETGLTVFEVKWTGGERENLGTREVLELAKGQPGVVTPEENDERVFFGFAAFTALEVPRTHERAFFQGRTDTQTQGVV